MTRMPFLLLATYLVTVSLPLASEAQALAKDQVVEVSFEFVQNEIILRVRVNDQGPFNMAVDTGTDPSVIDLATARKIGLKLADKGHRGEGGGTGVNLGYETKLPIVAIASLVARNVEAAAIDLSHISDRLGMPLHGVLGHSLLNHRIVQIDYPKHVVRFYSTSPYTGVDFQRDSAKYTKLSFRYDDDVLVDEVYVNGHKVTANFDTGGGGNSIFKFTQRGVAALGLEDKLLDAHDSASTGYNGAYEDHEGKLDAVVAVGTITVQSPLVAFFPKGTGHDEKRWSVNIGNAFLKDYIVTIDYVAKVVVLERP